VPHEKEIRKKLAGKCNPLRGRKENPGGKRQRFKNKIAL